MSMIKMVMFSSVISLVQMTKACKVNNLAQKIVLTILFFLIITIIVLKGSVPGGFLAGTPIQYVISSFYNLNSVEIIYQDKVRPKSLIIFCKQEDSDYQKVYSTQLNKQPNIRYVYGKHKFKVVIDGKEVKQFLYFKENNWHSHIYRFTVIYGKHKEPSVKIEVI